MPDVNATSEERDAIRNAAEEVLAAPIRPLSAEPSTRVTDEPGEVIDRCVIRLANTQMNMSLEEWGEISNALLGVGIAHRATEAKLTAALAGLAERTTSMNTAVEAMMQAQRDRRTAESALAATKAKLEAAERAIRCALPQAEGCHANHYGDNPEGSAEPEHIRLMRAALTNKETTDAN